METVTITKTRASEAQKAAEQGATIKQVLDILFHQDKKVSDNRPITERVKTFEDALAIVGASDGIIALCSYDGDDLEMIASSAHARLTIIAKALNEGWKPDWNKRSEYKWYPWFDMEVDDNNPSGFRFYDSYYDYSASGVGSRLCFKSEELAKYAGQQFENIYKELFTV